jgi:hypothetical protein
MARFNIYSWFKEALCVQVTGFANLLHFTVVHCLCVLDTAIVCLLCTVVLHPKMNVNCYTRYGTLGGVEIHKKLVSCLTR